MFHTVPSAFKCQVAERESGFKNHCWVSCVRLFIGNILPILSTLWNDITRCNSKVGALNLDARFLDLWSSPLSAFPSVCIIFSLFTLPENRLHWRTSHHCCQCTRKVWSQRCLLSLTHTGPHDSWMHWLRLCPLHPSGDLRTCPAHHVLHTSVPPTELCEMHKES